MRKNERAIKFIEYFSENLPDAKTELEYENVFQLTVAVILSAQCTDKRVNIITKKLFTDFPDVKEMAKASVDDIYSLIKSCTYPMSKSKYLYKMSRMLVNEFNSKIPSNLNDLQKLPGVGRKTANVIGSVYFNIPAMPVDTHVFRVSNRIGLTTKAKNPNQTEMQLVKIFPREKLSIAHHWLILHGRYVCIARKPKCSECGIKIFCKYYSKMEFC